MTTKEFKLPDVGEGVAEGELVNWLVEPGDTVSEDQAVAEVETDKALVEVPSPYNGTVKELHAAEGEMVPVGSVIITYEVEGEAESTAEASPEAETQDRDDLADVEEEPGAADATGAEADSAAAETTPAGETPGEETDTPSGRVFAPPSARRLARELGVDLAAVDGGGPGGRVTDADVRAAAEGAEDAAATADEGADAATDAAADSGTDEGRTSAVTRRETDETVSGAGLQNGETTAGGETATGGAASVEAAGRERTLAVPATRRVAEEEGVDLNDVPTDETRDGEAFVTAEQVHEYARAQREAREAEVAGEAPAAGAGAGEAATGASEAAAGSREAQEERVPYRGVRRTIGKQMERSKYTAPHVTHHDQVVIDELVDLRADLKARAEDRGVRLTYMPFVMKALVAALKEFPYLNSTLEEFEGEDEGEIVLKNYYNIGIAVATDSGLMVPVVKDVDRKSVLELAEEVNDLASRARERKVTREEMQGGTFTITNFGAIGGEYATPIINYPETAIMGLGAIDQRPVVEGEGDDASVVPRHTLPLSLSIDHRVIDGAIAAEFTNRVMEYLEDPMLLLLE